MALIIKQKNEQGIEGDRIFITDITGEFNDPDNLGGYGTQNPDLNTLCLLSVIHYNSSDGGAFLNFVGSQYYWNNSELNDYETILEANYISDGWHTATLIALPVSQNRNQDLNGNQMNDGDHFYYTGDSKIHVKLGQDLSEEVDPNTVIDQIVLDKVVCEIFYQSKLLIYREQEYSSYRRQRTSVCAPSSIFNELRELTEDIISSEYTFRSGLKVEAQNQIELVLDEKNL